MARKRAAAAAAAAVDVRDYGESYGADSDYEPQHSDPYESNGADSDNVPQPMYPHTRKRRQKSARAHYSHARRAPSLVTPEQIIANAAAAAAAQHAHSSRSGEQQHSNRRHSSNMLHAAASSSSTIVKSEQLQDSNDRAMTRIKSDTADRIDDADADVDSDNDNDDNDASTAPVVFQCGTCRSIFGDSCALVGSNAELLLLTLSAATNVTLSTHATSTEHSSAIDAGSAYRDVLCSQCQAVLGRQYVTTPPALDKLRGLFSFFTMAIASYQLGYPQHQQTIEMTADRASTTTRPALASVGSTSTEDRTELLELRADMTKVQRLLLVVDERLQHLEDAHEQLHESETEQ